MFKAQPDLHPRYQGEWKEFWSRKFKELISEGRDAINYDYKEEWINFWMKRMRNIHDEKIKKTKQNIRKQFSFSPDVATSSESHSKLKKRSVPMEISDDSGEDENKKFHGDRASTYDTSAKRLRQNPQENKSFVDDTPINLITVCRLLLALEKILGLLAQPVLNLLSKAVACEKRAPNSADELLYIAENSNVLDTVKEKLKGHILANIISEAEKNVAKHAIQNIASLQHAINKEKEIKVSQSLSFDDVDGQAAARQEIASVIAESLVMQGKFDVSPQEIENLVESLIASHGELRPQSNIIDKVEESSALSRSYTKHINETF